MVWCLHAARKARAVSFVAAALAAMVSTAVLSTAARADLVISSAPTSNVTCNFVYGANCNATAADAVLNADELSGYLATKTYVYVGAGALAKNLVVNASLRFKGNVIFDLEAGKSVIVNASMAIGGRGTLQILTTPPYGEFVVGPNARIDFHNRSSKARFALNGVSYQLFWDLPALAAAIATDRAGHYALGGNYDAGADGTYLDTSAIPTQFDGSFEGLGHTIANLSFDFGHQTFGVNPIGLFERIGPTGSVGNLHVTRATLLGSSDGERFSSTGILAADNYGLVRHVSTSGSVTLPDYGQAEIAGGLVGANAGTIENSSTDANVYIGGFFGVAGGLVAANSGVIDRSYATGSVNAADNNYSPGGIAGWSSGLIKNSYSLMKVVQNAGMPGNRGYWGGLLGEAGSASVTTASYSAGQMGSTRPSGGHDGGLVGFLDTGMSAKFAHTYWNLDKGVRNPSRGAGNAKHFPGITGLTTAELQSGLPKGFDPKIWAQSPGVNGGLPYLIDNAPLN